MNSVYRVKASPENIRRLSSLKGLFPNLIVDDSLLAKEEPSPEGDWTPNQIRTIRALRDFNLRGGIIIKTTQIISPEPWLKAVLYAAKSIGLSRVVYRNNSLNRTAVERVAHAMGMEAESFDGMEISEDRINILRKTGVLVMPLTDANDANTKYRKNLALEFYHTVVVGPVSPVSSFRLFPTFINYHELMKLDPGYLTSRGMCPNRSRYAEFFNITNGMITTDEDFEEDGLDSHW